MNSTAPQQSMAGSRPRKTAVCRVPACNNNALRKATRNLGRLFDDVVEPTGLRAAQFGVLVHISALNAPTMKALASELVMDLSALGHTLKPLIRDGYVDLRPDESDRRSKRVTLTRAGEDKCQEATKLWKIAQARFEKAFGTEQAATLREMLTVIASDDFAHAFVAGNQRP